MTAADPHAAHSREYGTPELEQRVSPLDPRMRGDGRVEVRIGARVPAEVPVGGAVTLTVQVSCRSGCDRTGLVLSVTAPDGGVTAHMLARHADGVSESGDIVLTAPARVGSHMVRIVMPAHTIDGTDYAEAALDLPLRTAPQTTSLAVWDVPSPIEAGARFTVSAGAKSAGGCALAGQAIELCEGERVVARGTLGDAPLPGTAALYWCALDGTAPAEPGVATWSVRFPADGVALPHDGAATAFSLAVVPAPDCRLTVKVVEQESCAPIADVALRLGAYRAVTGAAGTADIALPKGRYELCAWKVGYDAAPRPVVIDADAAVEIAATVVPEEDPDARWRM